MIVAALLVAGACRERATVTGTYGAGVVAGQVAVTGLVNTSPAGVQVTVRGTGMTTTLAEDGAFTFADVPDGAVLVFQRADGINATLELRQSSGFVNVALSAGGATVTAGGGKRRSAGGTRKEYEFEGLVRSASATELVVFTSHQEEVTFTLDASTVIRKGQTTVAAEDLTEGVRVHVKAAKVDDAYTAVQVIVQDEDNGGDEGEREAKEYEGLVRSATATQLVILDSHGDEVTFVLNASTEILKGQTPVLATDLREGDRVHVRATTAEGGTKTASLVIVQNAQVEVRSYEGTATSASNTQLVVDVRGTTVTFVLTASTSIKKGNTTLAGSDIGAGDKVNVKALVAPDGTKTATEVRVQGGGSGKH
jgi:hypothetical protein